MGTKIRDTLLANLTPDLRIDKQAEKVLRIYFNNSRNNEREPRDLAHQRMIEVGPLRLEEYFEADCFRKLEERCFKMSHDGFTNPDEWRDTIFTRNFGVFERKIMSNIAERRLYLVEFRDEQTPDSWKWELFNKAGHERCDMVPVWRMAADRKGFDFILRPWQRQDRKKPNPITIVARHGN